jgi:hypothetical protein
MFESNKFLTIKDVLSIVGLMVFVLNKLVNIVTRFIFYIQVYKSYYVYVQVRRLNIEDLCSKVILGSLYDFSIQLNLIILP